MTALSGATFASKDDASMALENRPCRMMFAGGGIFSSGSWKDGGSSHQSGMGAAC